MVPKYSKLTTLNTGEVANFSEAAITRDVRRLERIEASIEEIKLQRLTKRITAGVLIGATLIAGGISLKKTFVQQNGASGKVLDTPLEIPKIDAGK